MVVDPVNSVVYSNDLLPVVFVGLCVFVLHVCCWFGWVFGFVAAWGVGFYVWGVWVLCFMLHIMRGFDLIVVWLYALF